MNDIYEKLQKRLDDMSSGFPKTEKGTEIRILKRLFSEEEAELFLYIMPMLETPETVASRLNRDKDEIEVKMEAMAKKGLLFRKRKENTVKYASIPYIVGIFEYQVNSLDPEIAKDMDEYFEEAFGKTVQSHKTPVMRTIPINKDLIVKWPVAPYEDVLKIIDSQETITLAPCICRKTTKLAGKGCDNPVETCLLFGSHGEYYAENKFGRSITKKEAKQIALNSEKAGLVMQPFNSQRIGGMCSCCGDCCGILRSLKMQPKPAGAVQSNYFAEVEDSACTGCEVCLTRCQMDAITVKGETASVNTDRCIGCGLCVTTCAPEAVTLIRKPEDKTYEPPETGGETYLRLAKERGKI